MTVAERSIITSLGEFFLNLRAIAAKIASERTLFNRVLKRERREARFSPVAGMRDGSCIAGMPVRGGSFGALYPRRGAFSV
jgi:hypothetical protein